MNFQMPQPDGAATIELDFRTAICAIPDCGGKVVRHSLGGGLSVDRCMRCFRRYQTRTNATESERPAGRLRRMLDEFVGWRDE